MQPTDTPFTNVTDLKELPHSIEGTFEWINETPIHDEWTIGHENAAQLPSQLDRAITSADKYGITLPPEFVTFIRTPSWHRHIRSASGCYLDIADSVLPLSDGFLLRFLNDQQGCAFWYIYTNSNGSEHCVVLSNEYFDADEIDNDIEDLKETDFHFCAISFEAFLSSFWIENEIMFAECDGTPLPEIDPRFLNLYAQ